MTVTAPPAAFPIEAVFNETLALFQKYAQAFIIALLIGGVPSFLGNVLGSTDSFFLGLIGTLFGLVGIVTTIAAYATVVSAALSGTAGGSANTSIAYAGVVPRLVPLVLLEILVGVIVSVGLALLIVPGVIAACALCVALPVFLDENIDVVASLQRSFDLTKGNWVRLFLMFLIVGVVIGIVGAIAWGILSFILGGLGQALVFWGFGAAAGAFIAILGVVTYRKLTRGAYA
jgi:hypothetical protein